MSAMAEVGSALSAISTAFTLTLRIAEKVYEIKAVDQETRDLLGMTDSINQKLEVGRKLRRQKSDLFEAEEKMIIDTDLNDAEKAVNSVAGLIEPARADMQVYGGRIRVGTRIIWVVRDSAHIAVSLGKLNIAASGLNSTLSTLMGRTATRNPTAATNTDFLKPPPTYQESEWLYASREKNLLKRASMRSLTGEQQHLQRPSSAPSLPDVIKRDELVDTTAFQVWGETQRAVETPPLPARRLTGKARNHSWLNLQSKGLSDSTNCSRMKY
ncbi:hypothetical protein KC343_g693 [Hortaea werneckii]|uniref:Uncharacterized protein n=1 Tax=Hortaea werneckii TaxID=91943 RepID=A0A3M7GFU5_HORWE|nr:hypothetical protein KC317_g822 [Hortaea werneckii]KAI7626842.1 hypothetical protein KC346_g1046 [Hortaea werneckii]KAI7637478.1 hypothetical protein KC343_g693 [Hortaea werneckii]KAI7682511.1 hypothetical protein KC319_g972 [Hortaea werneckii]KAI7718641.1 hypothetical protein KC322_g2171 [Hortaea werneckii]